MSRADELRETLLKERREDEPKLQELGKKYYDYVVDVMDALSASVKINKKVEVNLRIEENEQTDKKQIITETNPDCKKHYLTTRDGREVSMKKMKGEADERAYDFMKQEFHGEANYSVDINGSSAKVTLELHAIPV